jgi:hypothetical protein
MGLLALVHLFFPVINRAVSAYHDKFLSITGGVAIGYVFLYVLPKLTDYTFTLLKTKQVEWEFLQYGLYVITLAGLLSYLALDRFCASDHPHIHHGRTIQGLGFCIYNLSIGYVVSHIPRTSFLPVVLATLVLGTHLLGIDHQLRHGQEKRFDQCLRWWLAGSMVVGWSLGMTIALPKMVLAGITAFLGGAIIINVLTEELPDRREERFLPFLLGVGSMVIIAAIIRSFPKAG